MFNVCFRGETAGSISKKSTKNRETTGSVAYKKSNSVFKNEPFPNDTINFQANNYKKKDSSSTFINIAALLGATAIIIGGLGYAHKTGCINKIKNKTIKDFVNKIAKPCHKWCGSLKQCTVKLWNNIKNCFSKKS